MPNQITALDPVLQALACPARRTIVERLTQGEASVSQLAAPLAMALPSVLQHLQVLEDSGLVHTKKVGRVRRCRLDPAALVEAETWLATMRARWEARFDRLDAYARDLKRKETDHEPD